MRDFPSDVAFTPSVKAAQDRRGSRKVLREGRTTRRMAKGSYC